MLPVPRKSSLVAETVRIMQERIRSGHWRETLPGERFLVQELQVGRNTLRLALKKLEAENWIGAASSGNNRRILKKKAANRHLRTSGVIALLSPICLEAMQPTAILEVDELRRRLELQGKHLEIVTPALFHLKSPAPQLEAVAKNHPADAWILYQTTPLIQEWFQQKGLPCLIRGHPHAGIHLPFLDTNFEATAFHAGGVLTKLGHRRICLVLPDQKLEGLAAARAGLERALANREPENCGLVPIVENGTKANLIAKLARLLNEKPAPTALVTTRPRQVLVAILWLASHGKQVPRDLSLISLMDDPVFEFLTPTIATYHVDAKEAARSLANRIQSLIDSATVSANSWIFPDYRSGESVAPPR